MRLLHRSLALLAGVPLSAWAHEGHGASGAHLHAWDTLGVLACVAVVLVVIGRIKKK